MINDNDSQNIKKEKLPPIWKRSKLIEVSIIKGRIGWKGLTRSEFSNDGVLIVNGPDIKDGKVLWDKCLRIPRWRHEESADISVRKGDILVTKDGTIGKTAFIDDLPESASIASGIFLIRTKNEEILNGKFLYQYFNSENFKELVESVIEGSVIPHLYQRDLEQLTIPLPPLNEQKAIVKILSNLDSKIELTQKMNKTLEAIAQAIFKHWFIDFEFPNEEGRPYKSSGGEMVDSELGEIPSKWKIGRLIDLTLNFDSKRVPLSSREREVRTGTYPYYGAASLLDFVDSYIFDGIYLLVGEDGTVIDEHGHPILQYVFGRFWVNNHAHVIQGKYPFSTEYVYLLLKQLNVKHIVTGAVQAKINQANLNSITVVMPPADLVNVFNRLIEGVFSKLRLNKNEMDSLTELREILLPKLISGKIRVPLEE